MSLPGSIGVLLALAAVAAMPAGAGTILYATAASEHRIDGFCVAGDGALSPVASVRHATGGPEPRRVQVVEFDAGATRVLYVGEQDRIEVFRIGARGGLDRIGATPRTKFMDVRDFAVDPVRRKLYVPQRGRNRIVAYTLDAEGAPVRSDVKGGFSSCLQGPLGGGYLNVHIEPAKDLLYVSQDIVPGRIDVHRLAPDGELMQRDGTPAPPSTCLRPEGATSRQPVSLPFSQRKRLQKPNDFLIVGDMLYVEERSIKRLSAFRLMPNGAFCDTVTEQDIDINADCAAFVEGSGGAPGSGQLATPRCLEAQATTQTKKGRQHCPASHTGRVVQYQAIVLAGETILGTQFSEGRIDAYRLRPDPQLGDAIIRLPEFPSAVSEADVRMTPVRLAAHDGVLYVAAGELDRVIAYRLTAAGGLTGPTPFSQTEEQKGSFPNDVAVAVLPEACG